MGIRRVSLGVGALALAASMLVPAQAFAAEEEPVTEIPAGEVATFPTGETRLQGEDRYDTAIEISQQFGKAATVFVATGENFPDALAAAAAAAHGGFPLLLTPQDQLPEKVKNEIERLDPTLIQVVGGEGAVSEEVVEELKATGTIVTRLDGADRYATAHEVVNTMFVEAEFAVIATGRSFPDALAATSVAGLNEGPVILVDGTKTTLDNATLKTLTDQKVKEVMIAGGTGAVSQGIEDQLEALGYDVDRQGGKDRYETAALMNSAYFMNWNSTHYMLATGQDFPDALAGGALAARIEDPQLAVMPIYLTRPECMPAVTKTSLIGVGIENRVVLGATGAVSENAAKGIVCAMR